ncbi:lipid-A-disaccharide synthase [Sutterella sp.]|uniref:lipid-A-disaccharide synthase n=1 Tax=Sutterella sp. TaxID=1981025 RepID=UPI0026E041D5|nr:lipid-A-disaccharide synthase [Sutterella sp.]MDO5531187.1 lipid-A-disaccharide synthase [Sutterella sp.]
MGTHQQNSALENHGVIWLAGEASGDYIASLALDEVSKRFDGAPQYGVGGSRMREKGFHAWHDIRELSVRGYVEVIAHLPRLIRLRNDLVQRFAASSPRVFVGVDAPDFNLGIEQQLRRRGIPTVHYVSPSIWAWRPERIHQIRRSVDHMLLVFPFEQAIYRRAGIDATYVGHPLASVIPMEPDREAARRDYGLGEDSLPVVTVMPGSRLDEVKGCAPAFFGAVEKLLHRMGDMHVLIPAADEQARERIIFIAGQYARLAQRMIVRIGESHRMIEAADAVLVASGTATLEAALYKKPMVVGYSMPALTGVLMQKKGLVRHVSLPNILMGENVVPEFLQYYCRADQISWALEEALTNEAKKKELAERFSALHETLRADTASLVAEVLASRALRRW